MDNDGDGSTGASTGPDRESEKQRGERLACDYNRCFLCSHNALGTDPLQLVE